MKHRAVSDSSASVRQTQWALGICFLVLSLNDFVAGPLLEISRPGNAGFPVALICIGLFGVQLALHAVWCVFAPYSRARRIAVAIVAAVVLIGMWILGMVMSAAAGIQRSVDWEAVRLLLCLPLLALAIQSPLWAAKYCLGWRIALSPSDTGSTARHTFGIRDLLIAMAVGACVLSAARLAVPLDTPTEQSLLPITLGAGTLAVVNLLTTIPIMLATLRVRRLAWPIAVLLLYGTAFTWAAISLFVTVVQQDSLLIRLILASIAGSYLLGLTACMLVARWVGWRLVWSVSRPTSPCSYGRNTS